jgi:hypothetical protein
MRALDDAVTALNETFEPMVYRDPVITALAATLLSGCATTAIWGNLAVFAVSVGIFLSTLALGHGR